MPPAPKYSIEKQEELVLDAAAICIEESSLLDFKMSDISKRAKMSMGSVYKHIQTKEDVLIALAAKITEQALNVFKETLSLPITTPEKLVAVHLLSPEAMYLYRFGAHLHMLAANEAILSRASLKWITILVQREDAIEQLFYDLLADALSTGELEVNGEDDIIEEIMIGHWSIDTGFMQAVYQRHSRKCANIGHPLPFPLQPTDPIIQASIKLTNAYSWKTPVNQENLDVICHSLGKRGYR